LTRRTSHAPSRDLAEEPKATKSSWKEYAPRESVLGGKGRKEGGRRGGAEVSYMYAAWAFTAHNPSASF